MKNQVTIKNSKTLEVDISNLGRTKRQQYAVKQMINENDISKLLQYIHTKNGNRHRLIIPKPESHGKDDTMSHRKNRIFNMFKDMIDPNNNHVPLSKKQGWFGIEIECFIPFKSLNIDPDDCYSDCTECGGCGTSGDEDGDDYDCDECGGSSSISSSEAAEKQAHKKLKKCFLESKIKYASIKSDGSLEAEDDNEQFTVEITLLTRLDDLKNLKQVCELLSKLGAKVNTSCGMHVHLDCRHLNEPEVINLGKTFLNALPVLQAMVPKSRRDNRYCKGKMSASMSNYDDRYCAINTTSYLKYKTLEIRLHSGTTDFKKITNWLTILDSISRAKIPKKCSEINDLTNYVSIPESVVEYMGQRTALFSPEKNVTDLTVCETDSTDEEYLELNATIDRMLAESIVAESIERIRAEYVA